MRFAAVLATLIALSGPSLSPASPITYNLNLLPDSTLLTGSITTDGTLGALAKSNILSWSWSLTRGSEIYSVSNLSSGANINLFGLIRATASDIIVESESISGQDGLLELFSAPAGFLDPKVGWVSRSEGFLFDFRGLNVPSQDYLRVSYITPSFAIASVSVPEPGALGLVLAAAAAATVACRVSGRREAKLRRREPRESERGT